MALEFLGTRRLRMWLFLFILIVVIGCGSTAPIKPEEERSSRTEEQDSDWLLIESEMNIKKDSIKKALMLFRSYEEAKQKEGERRLFEFGALALPALEEMSKGADAAALRASALALKIRFFHLGEEPASTVGESLFNRKTIIEMKAVTDFVEMFLSFGELEGVGAVVDNKSRNEFVGKIVSLDVGRNVLIGDALKTAVDSLDCALTERFNSIIATTKENADLYRFGMFVDIAAATVWQRQVLAKNGLKFGRYNTPLEAMIEKLNSLTSGRLNIVAEQRHNKLILDLVLPSANIYEQLSLIAVASGLVVRYRQASLVFCEPDEEFIKTAEQRKMFSEKWEMWRKYLPRIRDLWKQLDK
jgi:hypothetical protein